MTQTNTAIPCLDPHAGLSEAHKNAALNAGYGIPFLSEEAKYAQAQAARREAEQAGTVPTVK